jgi:hypothetical protein
MSRHVACYNIGSVPRDTAYNAAQFNVVSSGIDGDLNQAQIKLNEVFAQSDALFNAATDIAGGSPPSPTAIAALGLFRAQTHLLFHGPTTPIGTNPYVIGSGSMGSVGIVQSSALEASVETVFKQTYGPTTTAVHDPVQLVYAFEACDGKHAVYNSVVHIQTSGGTELATVLGLLSVVIPNSPSIVPTIDWYHGTVTAIPPPQ